MQLKEVRIGRIYATAGGRRYKVMKIDGVGDDRIVMYRGPEQANRFLPLAKFAEMVEECLVDPAERVVDTARRPGEGIKL